MITNTAATEHSIDLTDRLQHASFFTRTSSRTRNPPPLPEMQSGSISPILARSWREDARQLARLPRHSAMRCREPTESPKAVVKSVSKPGRTEKTLEEKAKDKRLPMLDISNMPSFLESATTAQSISTEEIPGPRCFHKRLATKRTAGVGARLSAASVSEMGEQLVGSGTSDPKSEACEATDEGPGGDVSAIPDGFSALILLADIAVKSLDPGVAPFVLLA
ncbi:hypothetical protein DFH06DRAFT_1328257 [Mycena polygramma]|nr:hypothetical protein DFH06DRAFT_1328257 [Mycena polygramma]